MAHIDFRPPPSLGTIGGMSATLLERDQMLGALADGVDAAAAGAGSVVLVTGEAGIGKTSLLRAFVDEAAGRARLRQVNLSGVIVGKALYEQRFTIAEGQAALDKA